jgi:hypothetical protein
MPTTSNFGWTTPADTDLVKDGASAIRTLGNGIDTSMAQLKGGTTGQILSKTSNSDMAFTWIANDQGDITAVTAGTGLTGGGTTGAVTLTNDMATAIDAKGDLIAGTGADTYARLAVGTNGQYLQADSTAATGLKWGTVSTTPTFVGASVSNSGSQSIANTTETIMTFDTEQFDTDGFHSTSSNTGRMTIPTGKGGKYLLSGFFNPGSNGVSWEFYVYVNGSYYITGFPQTQATGNTRGTTLGILNVVLNLSAADYVEVKAWQESGGNSSIRNQYGRYQISYLGA